MEENHIFSQYRKIPVAKLVSISDYLDLAESFSLLPGYKSVNSKNHLLKIILECYQIIGPISSYSGNFLLNAPDDFCFYRRLHDVLKLLKANNWIKDCRFSSLRYNDAPFFYSVSISRDYPKSLTDGRTRKPYIGHGFGKDAGRIFSQALGEFLERYFLSIYRKKDLLRGSLKILKEKKIPAIDLNLLAGFSEEQKRINPGLRFDENSVFYWQKAKRVLTEEAIYLPAQFIHWNYARDELEPFLCEVNTSGAGGMFSKEEAILSGLYEIIQRDGFLIHWLNCLTPELIEPKTIPHEGFQELLGESERYGFEVYCLNVTANLGIPVFAVVISDPTGKGPRFCLGAGCQADPAKALYRAIEEAWSVYYWIRPHPPFFLDKDHRPFGEVIGQEERLRLWANPEMERYFKFFISGKKKPFAEFKFDYPEKFSSAGEELKFLTKRIEGFGPGYEIYYYQSPHPFLSEIGYYSVQVVAPQLLPLYLIEVDAPLGSRRIKEAPFKLGSSPSFKINPLPHPFP